MAVTNPTWWIEGVSTKTTPGHVYFIQGEGGGLIKIGWATNPAVRLKAMQMVCPVRLVMLLSFPGSGDTERALHKRFANLRAHGEWFEPSAALLAVIEELRAYPPEPPVWPVRPPPEPITHAPLEYEPGEFEASERLRGAISVL